MYYICHRKANQSVLDSVRLFLILTILWFKISIVYTAALKIRMYYTSAYQPAPPNSHGYLVPNPMHGNQSYQHPPMPQAYERLTIKLPVQEYKPVKKELLLVPFDSRLSDNGKFDSLLEAMDFISKHCLANHPYFTKQLARKYLDMCRIFDGPTGNYIVLNPVPKKEFDAAFHQVRQAEPENPRKRF